MKISICHPDRKSFARGLCSPCYQKIWRTENLERKREYDRIRAAKDRKKHPEEWKRRARESYKRHAEKRRIYQKIKSYGITEEIYRKMIADSRGLCSICKLPTKEPTIDHDHTTRKVRGVLCHKCNQAIGLFQEKIENFESAIIYLNLYKKI